MKNSIPIFLFLILGCKQIPNYILSNEIPEINKKRKAALISAFFGLDNAMPFKSIGLWYKAPGKDGMPLVFSHEIDERTLSPLDFLIATQNGEIRHVEFCTLRPSVDKFELRTVLLIGEFGNSPKNPPVELKIVGDLKTLDGQNLKGQKIKITPLEDGPFLSYSEYFMLESRNSLKKISCDCPKNETRLVVKSVWSGGVKAINGMELGKNDLASFTISLIQNTDTINVHPFALADLNDNDNNIDICLNVIGIPIGLKVNRNTVIDPRADKNELTKIKILKH